MSDVFGVSGRQISIEVPDTGPALIVARDRDLAGRGCETRILGRVTEAETGSMRELVRMAARAEQGRLRRERIAALMREIVDLEGQS